MPSFATPDPISVTVELGVGDVHIVAGDRTETTVEVRPTDESRRSDVAAAQQTRVDYAHGRLLIRGPSRGWRQYSFRAGGESIEVRIDLPAGSQVRCDGGVSSFRTTGCLGGCHIKTGVGEVQVDQADGPVELKVGAGDISVERTVGHADVSTGSGAVRIATADASAVIKNSNGDTWIGQIAGDLRVNAGNGRIVVDQARATITAKTANGDIRLGEVARGAVTAATACGKVDIGISDGVTAWLDLHSGFGHVRHDLEAAEGPSTGRDAVEVRARTSFGDITVHRVPAHQPTR